MRQPKQHDGEAAANPQAQLVPILSDPVASAQTTALLLSSQQLQGVRRKRTQRENVL